MYFLSQGFILKYYFLHKSGHIQFLWIYKDKKLFQYKRKTFITCIRIQASFNFRKAFSQISKKLRRITLKNSKSYRLFLTWSHQCAFQFVSQISSQTYMPPPGTYPDSNPFTPMCRKYFMNFRVTNNAQPWYHIILRSWFLTDELWFLAHSSAPWETKLDCHPRMEPRVKNLMDEVLAWFAAQLSNRSNENRQAEKRSEKNKNKACPEELSSLWQKSSGFFKFCVEIFESACYLHDVFTSRPPYS